MLAWTFDECRVGHKSSGGRLLCADRNEVKNKYPAPWGANLAVMPRMLAAGYLTLYYLLKYPVAE